jgi:hypothetical protein
VLPSTPRPIRFPILTVAQLVVSIAGGLISLLGIIILILSNQVAQVDSSSQQINTAQVWSTAILLGILAILSVPSIILSLRRLKGVGPAAASEKWFIRASLLLIAWAGFLALGSILVKQGQLTILMPLVDLFVVALPLIWILAFALRKTRAGSVQRFWGLVTGSIFTTMPLILIVEGLLVVGLIAVIGLSAVFAPGFSNIIYNFSQSAPSSQDLTTQLIDILTPMLSSPGVLYAAIFGFGIVIPLIEEFFKPLLIWAFVKRNLTPAEGFGIGLVCGAAFALIESLFALNGATDATFFATALGRTGTSLLHTFTTGMMGWAIASTWQDGKGIRIGLVYTGAVLLHGTWNFFALLLGYSTLPISLPVSVSALASAVPWLLGLLIVWMLTILFEMNRKLQAENPPPLVPAGIDQNSAQQD